MYSLSLRTCALVVIIVIGKHSFSSCFQGQGPRPLAAM